VTSGAGEELHDALKEENAAVFVGVEAFPTHELRGRNMVPFINWFAFAVVLWLGLDHFGSRRRASLTSESVTEQPELIDDSPGGSGSSVIRFGMLGTRALVLLTAAWVTYYLILAGHSGAQSVWG